MKQHIIEYEGVVTDGPKARVLDFDDIKEVIEEFLSNLPQLNTDELDKLEKEKGVAGEVMLYKIELLTCKINTRSYPLVVNYEFFLPRQENRLIISMDLADRRAVGIARSEVVIQFFDQFLDVQPVPVEVEDLCK